MPLQLTPILAGQLGEGSTLRDRPVLGPRNTLRPTFTIEEPLDGVTMRLRFAWQQTAAMWTQDIRTASGALVRQGLPLTASGLDLWATAQADGRMPGGQLWIGWGDQRPRAPGREDWRGDATLYYRPRDLVLAVAGTGLALL
jgi:hypothetical protein